MRTAPFLRQTLPKYQIQCTRSSPQIFLILIWPRGKNTTYTENSCTAHNFYEMLSCQLLPLETYICMLNMLVMERFLFACFVCCCCFVCAMLESCFSLHVCIYRIAIDTCRYIIYPLDCLEQLDQLWITFVWKITHIQCTWTEKKKKKRKQNQLNGSYLKHFFSSPPNIWLPLKWEFFNTTYFHFKKKDGLLKANVFVETDLL